MLKWSPAKRCTRSLWPAATRLATLLLCLYFGSVIGVEAATTTTALGVAPGTSVTAGTAVTLTATVTNPAPVAAGLVTFCDASAAHCTGPAILGTAQLTTGGTATIYVTLGVGIHRIKAVFGRTNANATSTSPVQTITVTGISSYLTTTAIQAGGTPGNYTLSAQLAAFGRVAPTGTLSFLDATNGNAIVASVPTEANVPPATMQLLGSPFVPTNALYESFVPAPGQNQTIGTSTFGVSVGDFNNDGIQDLVTASIDEGLLSVFLGKGDGTFQTRATFAAPFGSDPSAVAVGDFNRDGFQDLAVVNGFAGTDGLSILLGNGDGTFQVQVPYTAGTNPIALAAGDFNGDGFIDIVTVDNLNGTINLLLGNGDGTFQPQTTFPVGNGPYSVVVGDFDGDGNLDVAVSNNTDGTVSVLLGKGDGTFNPQATYTVGNGPRTLATGDFNADGFLDLAVANFADGTVSVLLGKNDGSGTFTVQPQPLAAGAGPAGVAVGDFNGDGFVDLAVTNATDNTFSIFLGRGDGTFQVQAAFPVNGGNAPGALAVGDFEGNGNPDLAMVNFGGTTMNVVLGVEAETLSVNNVSVTGGGTHNVFASYPGDTVYAGSQSPTVALVGVFATTTVLTASAQSVPTGSPFTFTATVTSANGTPTGTVAFFDGATQIGTGTLNASGVATLTFTLSVGTHTMTAAYAGDGTFGPSTSAPITVTVTEETDFVLGPATPTLSVNPGGKAAFVIVVTPVGGSFDNPVTLSVTGLPPGATATFTPTAPVPGANGAPSTMVVQMPKTAGFAIPTDVVPRDPFLPLELTALAVFLATMGLIRKPTLGPQRVPMRVLCVLLFAGVLLGFSGCNGGFIASPPQSFVITVTGTSGVQTHSTTVTLNVR